MTTHLFIIVCYRARGLQVHRKKQLDIFLPKMKEYMKKFNIKYTLMVFEQNDDEKFNRGKLFNIGYLESMKMLKPGESAYFCHQNVDVIPKNVDYGLFTNGFRDIQGWDGGLGAMYFCDGESYNVINGYPNDLWGWGGDDSALLERAKIMNIPIDRSRYNNGDTENIPDDVITTNTFTNEVNRYKVYAYDMINNNWRKNGLNSCNYSVQSMVYDENLNYYHVLVNL
jgi:N-terminal region of glycosyl transferase group 7